MTTKMTVAELEAFLARDFPQVAGEIGVETVAPMTATTRLRVADRHLRPGGTVSGPAIFMLADVGLYLAILAMTGPEALAVTTNASLDFLRKPVGDADLLAEARVLKLGRRLAVGDVMIRSEGSGDIVARAGLTYARPPS